MVFDLLHTTPAIRRFAATPVPDELLARCLTAATWAPSGANRQAWRFCVLRSQAVRDLLGPTYRAAWAVMRADYGLTPHEVADDPAKSRRAEAMEYFVEHFEEIPAYVLFCAKRRPWPERMLDGASIYGAVQNFALAARAVGLGTVLTAWMADCEEQLRALVCVPEDWALAALVPVGFPQGGFRAVRRRPLETVACRDQWDQPFAGDRTDGPYQARSAAT